MGKYHTEAKGKRIRQEREHREGDTIRILKDGDLPGGREKGSQREAEPVSWGNRE